VAHMDCFGHRAQHVSLRQYIDGLLAYFIWNG
jgi:hypothetical protein